jgi:hypothetical protein
MTGVEVNLPNRFLADLPPEATLGAWTITEACQTLKRNRAKYLERRSTRELIGVLCETGQLWREPNDRFRQLALQHSPAATGFPGAVLTAGLDAMFAEWTPENFERLLVQEFGDANRLERFADCGANADARRAARVLAPEFIVHVGAGNLPCPAIMSLVFGVLLRSAQFLKCATGTSFVPRLVAHALREVEPALGACLEIAEWHGGNAPLEDALFAEADCVTVTGSDETIAAVRARLPGRIRLAAYGDRVSFGYVTREALAGIALTSTLAAAAGDIAAWNQMGCLSPHVIYVETRGRIAPEEFAEMLAGELARREALDPRGPISEAEAAGITTRRHLYALRAAHAFDTRQWHSQGSTAWTVVCETDPRFQISCGHRFVYVKGVNAPNEAMEGADAWRGRVSTVGLAASEPRVRDVAEQFAQWGVSRLCPIGRMQQPPLFWRHDGRPALGDWVTWVDWEQT